MIEIISPIIGGALVGLAGRVLLGSNGGASISGTAAGAASSKILQAVEQAINSGMTGSDCWDWVFKVYQMAGYGGPNKTLKNITVLFKGQQYDSSSPSLYLPTSRYSELQAGDWIYVHNSNKIDRLGNHSDIFIRWVDQSMTGAVTASSPGVSKPGHYKTRDLQTNPIAWWMRGAI